MYKDMTAKEYMQKRKTQLKAAGLCVYCGKPARPGLTLCKKCAIRDADRAAKRKAKLMDEGLCYVCGKRPPEEGKNLCEECAERSRTRNRAWYAKQKEETAWKR